MRQVVIMRGPSGVGKSHYVREHFPDALVCSADSFFTKLVDGELQYRYDKLKLSEAHNFCMFEFIEALADEVPLVVVDNTNARLWEYRNYRRLAEVHSYRVRVVEMMPVSIPAMQACVTRAVHGVPEDVVARQCMWFETDPKAEKVHVDAGVQA